MPNYNDLVYGLLMEELRDLRISHGASVGGVIQFCEYHRYVKVGVGSVSLYSPPLIISSNYSVPYILDGEVPFSDPELFDKVRKFITAETW